MTDNSDESQAHWGQYYKMAAGRPPREFLGRTLSRFQGAGSAIDLGCGTGRESIFLLERGWQVLAIDQQASAIQTLRSSAAPDMAGRLQALVAAFETLDLPPADLIWAGISLPFCHPSQFDTLWRKICSALVPGGRFAGDFFGSRHAWSREKDMTFHTREQVVSLCSGLQLEYIVEEEGEQQTAADGIQHWHMFTISARRL
jgi:tellurite methyltransferase